MKGIRNIFKKNWKNISSEFTPELQKEWEEKEFSYEQVKEWINAGLSVSDADYARWCVTIKGVELASRWRNLKLWSEEYEQHLTAVTQGQQLSVDIINQIKYLDHSYDIIYKLTPDQQSLINELIPNIELKERYQKYGLCDECQQPKTKNNWCQPCISQHFAEDFPKWTSGNQTIDQFIQKQQLQASSLNKVLEWIPYERFRDIKFLAWGGFGKVYKASWIDGNIINWNSQENRWKRIRYGIAVVLKILNNSQNMSADFLQEVTCHKLFDRDSLVVPCHGISQDPSTKNYIMVMDYIAGGNLRQYLQNNASKLDFEGKLAQLLAIIKGLNSIHQQGLIHRDLHPGNILLSRDARITYITDLGLSQPANEENKGAVYGVLPYVAPEVLRGEKYTSASDIYSWGTIIYEILSGCPPYHNLEHDNFLVRDILKGLRPEFQIKIPQLSESLIRRCWAADPTQRPTAREIEKILNRWCGEIYHEKNTKFVQQVREAEEFNKALPVITDNLTILKTHPWAIYTSRLLSSQPQNSQKINDRYYSTQQPTLQLDDFTLDDLNLEDNQTEQPEAQIEIPPKGNN